MSNGQGTGFVLVAVLVLWIVGVAYAFSQIDEDNGDDDGVGDPVTTATPVPTPVALPTDIVFGTQLGEDGRVAEPQTTFEPGAQVFFSVWIGEPVDVEALPARLRVLVPAGTNLLEELSVSVEPGSLFVSGIVPSQLLEPNWYRYMLRSPEDELLASSWFRIGDVQPESIETFDEQQTVVFAAGAHTGYQFDTAGEVVGTKEGQIGGESSSASTGRAVFNGEPYLFVNNGIWAGHWVPESDAVRLREPVPVETAPAGEPSPPAESPAAP